jgi:hypothetical protein
MGLFDIQYLCILFLAKFATDFVPPNEGTLILFNIYIDSI